MLGVLTALGVMAHYRELVIMRTSGFSISDISRAVLKTAAILIFSMSIIGELLLPKLNFYANNYKISRMSNGKALRTHSGIWLRKANNYIFLGQAIAASTYQGSLQFVFDKQHKLKILRQIGKLEYANGQWLAFNVIQTRILSDKKILKEQFAVIPWEIKLNKKLFFGSTPNEMSLVELYRYTKNNSNKTLYKLTFWQRIFNPLAALVMMLLALPFIFGPLRSTTVGVKLLTGISIGFSFFILNKILGPVSLVYQFPPFWAALLPTLFFSVVGVILVVRRR